MTFNRARGDAALRGRVMGGRVPALVALLGLPFHTAGPPPHPYAVRPLPGRPRRGEQRRGRVSRHSPVTGEGTRVAYGSTTLIKASSSLMLDAAFASTRWLLRFSRRPAR